MAIAMLVDNPHGTQEIYDRVREQLGVQEEPAGGIFHAAGPGPNGGWRVIEIWESQDDAKRFITERLTGLCGRSTHSGNEAGPGR